MTNITTIAQDARKSISSYCVNTCKAKCCKRGFLLLMTDKETKAIVGSKVKLKKYQKEEVVIPSPNGFLMYNLEKQPCKNLDSKDMCKIHLKSERPLVCRDYPLFLVKDYFILANDCEANKNCLLEEYAIKLEKEGLRRV